MEKVTGAPAFLRRSSARISALRSIAGYLAESMRKREQKVLFGITLLYVMESEALPEGGDFRTFRDAVLEYDLDVKALHESARFLLRKNWSAVVTIAEALEARGLIEGDEADALVSNAVHSGNDSCMSEFFRRWPSDAVL
jgi:hypothetical protein